MPETILRPPGAALDDTTLRGLAADGIRTLIVGPTTVDLPEQPLGFAGPPTTSLGDGSLAADRPRTGERRPPRIGGRRGSGPGGAGPARRARDDLAGAARRDARRRAGVRRGRAAAGSVLPADGRGASRRRPGSHPPSREGSSRRSRRPTRRSSRHRRSGGSRSRTSPRSSRRGGGSKRSARCCRTAASNPHRLETMLLLAEARQYLTSTTEGLAFIDAARRSVRATVDDLALETVRLGDAHVGLGRDPGHGLERGTALAQVLGAARLDQDPRGTGDPVELAPGETETLRLQASLRSTGRFEVHVLMVSPSGRLIGETTLVVRSTAYNRIALLITIGAALVLLLRVGEAVRAGPDAAREDLTTGWSDDLTEDLTPGGEPPPPTAAPARAEPPRRGLDAHVRPQHDRDVDRHGDLAADRIPAPVGDGVSRSASPRRAWPTPTTSRTSRRTSCTSSRSAGS